MTKQDKRLERLTRKPPPTDLSWKDFVATLEALGFVLHETGGGSSHKYFVGEFDGVERVLNTSRPHPNGIMKIYQIREVVSALEEWGLL